MTSKSESSLDDVECKNYLLCKTMLPEWWYDCKGHWLCTNCDSIFGRELEIKSGECPVCYEIKNLAKWKCNHWICIKCTRNISFRKDI